MPRYTLTNPAYLDRFYQAGEVVETDLEPGDHMEPYVNPDTGLPDADAIKAKNLACAKVKMDEDQLQARRNAFKDVAEKISGSRSFPSWMTISLEQLSNEIIRRIKSEKIFLTPKKMDNKLNEIKNACNTIIAALSDLYIVSHIEEKNDKECINLIGLAPLVNELKLMTERAISKIPRNGTQRSIPNPEGLSAKETCCLMICRIWFHQNNHTLGVDNKKSHDVVELFWSICSKSTYKDNADWKDYFKTARKFVEKTDSYVETIDDCIQQARNG